jgi:hypothetical protein
VARLDDLQLTLDRGNAAKGSLAGLDEQYATAQALRNSALPQINQYGTVSPFAVLADVVGKSQGRKQMRELAPQRQQARADISSSASALPMYNARSAQEGRDQAQENFSTTTGLAKAKAKALADQQALDNARVAGERTIEDRINPATGLAERTETDGQGRMYSNNARVPNQNEWALAPTASAVETTEGIGKTSAKAVSQWNKNIRAADATYDAISEMTDTDRASFNDKGNQFTNLAIQALAPTSFEPLAESVLAGYPRSTQKMLVALNKMSADERNALFGGALTAPELQSSQKFLPAVMGRGLDWIVSTIEQNKMSSVHGLLDSGTGQRERLVRAGIIPEDYVVPSKAAGFNPLDTPNPGAVLGPSADAAQPPSDVVPTATNPATGEILYLRNGQWQAN